MTAWTKRLIALGLWIPFVLYGTHAGLRAIDRSVTPFPTSPLPERNKSELAKSEAKKKTRAARDELEAAAAFLSEENGPQKAVLVERNWVAKNSLQAFAPMPGSAFGGDQKKRFEELAASEGKLRTERDRIHNWLRGAVPPNAEGHLKNFGETLLEDLQKAGGAESEVTELHLKATHKCAVAFAELLAKEYEKEIGKREMPLAKSKPLNQDAEALLKMHLGYRNLTETSPGAQSNPTLKALSDRILDDEDEWKARRVLLDLFAEVPAEKSPENAKVWFKNVDDQFGKIKDIKTKTLIRDKVQDFCSAYIPEKLALDVEVLVENKPFSRGVVSVRYKKNGEYLDIYPALTEDPDGLNEETATKYPPPAGAVMDQFMRAGSSINTNLVKPTKKSQAAFEYSRQRKDLKTDRWTSATAAKIVKAGAVDADLWNQLSRIGKPKDEVLYNVYNRLKIVQESIDKYRLNLFP